MSMDNRNAQGTGAKQQNENDRIPPVNEQNPQEGDQWDNYQTRELSGESGAKIQEGDLLSADEAKKQQPQHRGE